MVDYAGGMAAQIGFEVTKGRAKVCIGPRRLKMLKKTQTPCTRERYDKQTAKLTSAAGRKSRDRQLHVAD